MNKLRELREEKNLSLAKLSKEVGISAGALGNYERGVREPKIETWEKLATYFNVPTAYLMGVSDEKESSTETIDKIISYLAQRNKINEQLNLQTENSIPLDSDVLVETMMAYDIFVINILLSLDYEKLPELKKIIDNIQSIYIRTTSKETTQSKEETIEEHLENINEITNILNKWYMNEMDKIKYNQKKSNELEQPPEE